MGINISATVTRDAIIDRLLDWHAQAKLAGRIDRADALLALSWYVYDRPPAAHVQVDQGWNGHCELPRLSQFRPCSAAILRAFPGLAELSKGVESHV
jgi:hypothetical protein